MAPATVSMINACTGAVKRPMVANMLRRPPLDGGLLNRRDVSMTGSVGGGGSGGAGDDDSGGGGEGETVDVPATVGAVEGVRVVATVDAAEDGGGAIVAADDGDVDGAALDVLCALAIAASVAVGVSNAATEGAADGFDALDGAAAEVADAFAEAEAEAVAVEEAVAVGDAEAGGGGGVQGAGAVGEAELTHAAACVLPGGARAPASHAVHAASPAADHESAGHVTQAALPPAEVVPARHAFPLALLAPGAHAEPAGAAHGEQAVAPAAATQEPAGQSAQRASPAVGA